MLTLHIGSQSSEELIPKVKGFSFDNHTRSSNLPPCANQTRATVLRDRFNSPALTPAVNYKLYPVLFQLVVIPYTLHLCILTCDQK